MNIVSDCYLIHAKQSRANSEEIEMTEYRKNYFMTNYLTHFKNQS